MKKHDTIRGWFAYELYQQMKKNKNIWLVSGDLGYKMFDMIRDDFPDRFLNAGSSEQAMMGIAVGLALKGKIPFVYSITPFLLYRSFETIRNYVNYENIPVKLIGGGRDKDYSHDGFSHWAEEDLEVMSLFSNINKRWPQTKEEIPNLIKEAIKLKIPYYINLRRE